MKKTTTCSWFVIPECDRNPPHSWRIRIVKDDEPNFALFARSYVNLTMNKIVYLLWHKATKTILGIVDWNAVR